MAAKLNRTPNVFIKAMTYWEFNPDFTSENYLSAFKPFEKTFALWWHLMCFWLSQHNGHFGCVTV